MSIDMSGIEKIIEEHMNEQPYKCRCQNCGCDLDVNASLDSEMDLILDVYPCPNCKGE